MPSGVEELRLLLIRDAFGHDGDATRFLALAEALRERGGEAKIVSGPGRSTGAPPRRAPWSSWTGPASRASRGSACSSAPLRGRPGS
jgi:hypothetical protein